MFVIRLKNIHWNNIIFFLLIKSQNCLIYDLNGEWLLNRESGELINLKAIVPGGIYTNLMSNNIINDIFYGYNDTSTRWVAKTNWIYYRNITVDSTFLNYHKINIVFEGLDTFATISINNFEIGKSQNMFVKYIFNVKGYLKCGMNTIKIHFLSPVQMAATLAEEQSKNYTIPPNCPPKQYHGECHVNQIRKMQASFSWDWGPAFPSMGIWKNVYLESFNSSKIRYVVTNIFEFKNNWIINVTSYLDGIPGGHLIQTIQFDDRIIKEIVKISKTTVQNSIQIPKAIIKKWWPNGYGEQKLYNFTTKLITDSEIHEKTIRIGFRIVELVQDQIGQGMSFYFKVNGIPIFAKGANQIPLDILPERGQNHETIENILRSVHETNMNMIRVWGGGVYESDYFYDLADELGILIWQDFMFACAMYPTRPTFLQNVVQEVQHQVKRLNNHPSIILWAGNNENEAALAGNWYQTATNFTNYKNDYIQLYINTIKREFQAISHKIFLSSSPTNGIESERENYVAKKPQNPQFGDVHYYNYILNSLDANTYPVPRFASEFGYQSLPDPNTWLKVTNNLSDLNPNSSFMEYRQHHPGGHLENTLLINYQLKLPKEKNENYYKTYIYYSQVMQALSIKYETELYRSYMGRLNEKGEGNTMGALFWQLNDVWIAPTWSGIGKWKMLQYFARNFFAPTIITGHLNVERELNIYIVSDSFPLYETSLEVTIIIEVYKWNNLLPINITHSNITITYGESLNVLVVRNTDEFLVDVGCGSLINARNYCFFRLTAVYENSLLAPENFIFPSKIRDAILLTPTIQIVSLTQIDLSGKKFEIILETNHIALFVWLDAYPITGLFSENGFIQTTNHKTIYFSCNKASSVSNLKNVLTITNLKDLQHIS